LDDLTYKDTRIFKNLETKIFRYPSTVAIVFGFSLKLLIITNNYYLEWTWNGRCRMCKIKLQSTFTPLSHLPGTDLFTNKALATELRFDYV